MTGATVTCWRAKPIYTKVGVFLWQDARAQPTALNRVKAGLRRDTAARRTIRNAARPRRRAQGEGIATPHAQFRRRRLPGRPRLRPASHGLDARIAATDQ